METTARKRAAGIREKSSTATGLPELIEVPMSPRRMFASQMRYCSATGLSRPSSARFWATRAGSAAMPPRSGRAVTGSPGDRYMRRNESSVTTDDMSRTLNVESLSCMHIRGSGRQWECPINQRRPRLIHGKGCHARYHTTFVGFDVHARSIKAVSLDVMIGEVRSATFGYDAVAVCEWIKSVDPAAKCVYKSGVTGFDLPDAIASTWDDSTCGFLATTISAWSPTVIDETWSAGPLLRPFLCCYS